MMLQQLHGAPVAARDYEAVAKQARVEIHQSLGAASAAGDADATLALLQDEVSTALSDGTDCFAAVEGNLEKLVAAGHEEARSFLLDRLPQLKAIWEKRHRRPSAR